MAFHPGDLRYFVEIARTGNISRAAEALDVSQPSLSKALRRLEKELGQRLFLRTKLGVQLTRSGKIFLEGVRAHDEHWEKVVQELGRTSREVVGEFVIGCHASVAFSVLPLFAPRLLAEHPGLKFRLEHALSREILPGVVRGEIDFGFVIDPVPHPELVIRNLASQTVGFWTATRPGPLQDPRSGVIVYNPQMLEVWAVLAELRKRGHRFPREIESSDYAVVASLVAAGAGLGILPDSVARELKGLGLKPWKAAPSARSGRLALIYRADAERSKASRAIVDAVIQAFL